MVCSQCMAGTYDSGEGLSFLSRERKLVSMVSEWNSEELVLHWRPLHLYLKILGLYKAS
jgi:hypothetical protein